MVYPRSSKYWSQNHCPCVSCDSGLTVVTAKRTGARKRVLPMVASTGALPLPLRGPSLLRFSEPSAYGDAAAVTPPGEDDPDRPKRVVPVVAFPGAFPFPLGWPFLVGFSGPLAYGDAGAVPPPGEDRS